MHFDAAVSDGALEEPEAGQLPHALLGHDDVLGRDVEMQHAFRGVQIAQRLCYLQPDQWCSELLL